jgi:hypothetical protein
VSRSLRVLVFGVLLLLRQGGSCADPLPVRHPEGVTHGFLDLRTLQGDLVGVGELSQVVRGDRVSLRLVYRFRDKSVQDESTVFSQRGTFRLLSDHLVQKGPTFSQPIDVTIDGASGLVKVRYADASGKEKALNERLTFPADVANGLLFTLLRNVPRGPLTTLSLVAATPQPRLVKLEIKAEGEDDFSIGDLKLKATRYVVHVNIGGIAGVVAPLVGMQPPDSHVWVLGGEAPTVVKAEAPLFLGGPVLQVEVASPTWP